jgi:hypothetical protein
MCYHYTNSQSPYEPKKGTSQMSCELIEDNFMEVYVLKCDRMFRIHEDDQLYKDAINAKNNMSRANFSDWIRETSMIEGLTISITTTRKITGWIKKS